MMMTPITQPHRWPRPHRALPFRDASRGRRAFRQGCRTILAIDDEPEALDVLRTLFEVEGFRFVQTESAPEALQLIQEQRPDLLIIDFMMPGMTGLDLCDYLRRDALTRDIPIIMHSAYSMRHSNSGLYDRAFVKPVDHDEMLSAIRCLLPP